MADQEDRAKGHSPQSSTVEYSFDELALGLASGTISRRKALKWMGGALLGGALVSIPSLAWAKPKLGKCNHHYQCPAGQTCQDRVCVPQQSQCVCDPPGGECPQGTQKCSGTMIGRTVCCPSLDQCLAPGCA